MSWSYSGDPTSSPKDEVRFLIGDTVAGAPITLSDQEINYQIAVVNGGVLADAPAQGNYVPAAYAAEELQARYSSLVDSKTLGDLSVSYANRAERLAIIAKNLRRRASVAGVSVYAGGQTWSDKRSDNLDRDRVQPAVKVDQFDYPIGPQSGNGPGGAL